MKNLIIDSALTNINQLFPARSAWDRGVREYATELLDSLDEAISDGWVDVEDLQSDKLITKALLNGAEDWHEFSWGGCSLIYNTDIAKRLCNNSELSRTDNGRRKPNAREEWLDCQARALCQACRIIKQALSVAFKDRQEMIARNNKEV